MQSTAGITTLGLLITIGTSSVVAALVTTGVTWLRDQLRTKKDDKFSALYLALTLEAYGAECATFLSDAETWISSHEAAGEAHGNLPELPPWPSDIDWKALGIDDTTRALTLAAAIASTRSYVSGLYEYDDEDAFLSFREKTAAMGKRALQLAQELRFARTLKPAEPASDWLVENYLDERTAEYAEIRRRDRERQAERKAEFGEEPGAADA